MVQKNLKRIVVYDKKKYFFRFVKNRYGKDFEIIKHVNVCDSNSIKTKDTFLVLFVAYEEEDVITFLNYYLNSNKIIVCSEESFILDKYKEIDDIDFLNISFLKSNITEILDFKFYFLTNE